MSPEQLIEHIAARLAPLLPAGSHVLVGLSGGVDSVVLLHALHSLVPRLDIRLSAMHVHHGISPYADAWAQFCAELCERNSIPLQIERVDIVPLRDEHGVEAAARKLRHAAFARLNCEFVALAHHADDQAETLLLQLLRGAGLKGVAAMPLARRQGRQTLLRPLLDCTRASLLDYAQQHDLRWVEDESNADERYPRNFLRHRLLPQLEQHFPAWRHTLGRSAQHFAEAGELLDEIAHADVPEGGVLQVSLLRTLTPARSRNLLRYFLHRRAAPMPQAAQLEQMLHQLCSAREDAHVCVTFGGWQVRRFHGQVYASPALGTFDRSLCLAWQDEESLHWPAMDRSVRFQRAVGEGISLEKLQRAPVSLRLRSGGESLRPHAGAARRTLKNLFQQQQVPPWLRERLPLLYCGEELVSVVGVAIAAEFQAGEGKAGLMVSCD